MSVLHLLIRVLRLFSGELELAQAEVAQALRRAVVGVLLLLVALALLAQAIALGTAVAIELIVRQGLTPLQASLIMTVLYLLLTVGLVFHALRRLHPRNIIPRRTVDGVRRDLAALTGEEDP